MRATIVLTALLTATTATAGECPGPYFEPRETFLGRHLYGYGPAYVSEQDRGRPRPRPVRVRR